MKKIEELIEEWKNGTIELGLYTSKNEEGENIIIEVSDTYFKTITPQNNGWSRVHYYYKDGTIEELYER